MTTVDSVDRRTAFRAPYNTFAGYKNATKTGVGSVANIGPDGMLLQTKDRFAVGEIIDIDFQFRHGHSKMNLQGEIARIDQDSVGIKFMWP